MITLWKRGDSAIRRLAPIAPVIVNRHAATGGAPCRRCAAPIPRRLPRQGRRSVRPAREAGRPASPCAGRSGSRSPPSPATHRKPNPNSIVLGPPGTLMGAPARSFVSGSIRITVDSYGFVTHTDPPATATSWQNRPSRIWWARRARGGRSTRDTPLPSPVATHTAPSPTATPRGPRPTRTGRPVRLFVRGSICTTVRSTWFVTHTAFGVTAMPNGPRPVSIGPVSWLAAGSTRTTVPLS